MMNDNVYEAGGAADACRRAGERNGAPHVSVEPPEGPAGPSLETPRVCEVEPAKQNEPLRATQATLEASRARYRDLYDRAPAGYVTMDEQGVVQEANRTAAGLLGVDRDALVGQTLAGFVLPEDRGVYRAHRKALVEPEVVRACELRMVRGEGDAFWARLDAANVRDERGSWGCRCVISDITEHRQAEEGLRAGARRATAQRQATVLLMLGAGIVDGTIDQALASMVEIVSAALGVARCGVWMLSEDRSELRCRELYGAGTQACGRGQVLAAAELPHYFAAIMGEGRISAADAQTDPRTRELADSYLIPLGITSMLDAGIMVEGRLLGVICLEHVGPRRRWHADEEAFASTVATLVAEWFLADQRKRAEEALRTSEDRYRNIVSAMSDVIFVLDEEDRFVDVHCRSQEALMRPPEAFLGKTVAAVMPAEVHALYRARVPHVRQRGENRRFEYSVPVHGKTRWFLASLDPHPDGRRIVAGVREITDRKQAEEALRKAHAELEQRVEDRTAELSRANERLHNKERRLEHLLRGGGRPGHRRCL